MRPHRLVAQDTALSRLKQGFKSPWGYQAPNVKRLAICQPLFYFRIQGETVYMVHGRHGYTATPEDAPKRPLRHGTIRRVISLYAPYKLALGAVVFLVLSTAILGVATPLLIRQIIDVAIPDNDMNLLYLLVGGMLVIAAVSGAMNLAQAYLNVRTGFRVMQSLRISVYEHLQKLPLSFFTSSKTGDIQSRLANDVSSTQLVLTDTLGTFVSNSAVVISSVIAMLVISWQLSLIAFLTVPVFVFFTVRVGRRRRRLTGETQRALADLTSRTGETLSISGVMLAKTFGRDQDQLAQFDENNRRLASLSIRQAMTGRGFFVVVQTFFTMAPAIVWLLGGLFISEGRYDISLGDIVAFTTIQARLLFPLSGLLNRGVDVTSSLALFDRIFEYLDIDPAIKDPANPVVLEPTKVRGEVAYKNVGFSYSTPDEGKSKDKPFELGGINIDVDSGGLAALVGPSGAGKTTVGYLLARLYDPDAGSITIDGVDIRDMKQRDLSRLIGVVSQDSFMFHTSVRENLLYGKPDANDVELEEATKAAQIFDLIDRLPERFNTVVGERGYRLSGGERQRLAIARVILANPRILLLDEATSSLDTLSERMIQQALARLREGRTTIAIAHRLSTVIAADQILVMENGRITDRGTNDELLERSELYRRLYEEQFTAVPSLA